MPRIQQERANCIKGRVQVQTSEGQAQVTQEVLEDEGSDRTQDSDRSGDAFVLGSGAREVYTEVRAAAVEQTAQKLMEQQQYQHRMCERVIQMLPQNRHKPHRSVLKVS